jgi:hypothetical protein
MRLPCGGASIEPNDIAYVIEACLAAGLARVSAGMSVSELDTPRVRSRRGLGPHAREHRLLESIDWRTREGQVLIAARAELTAHVGGNPNNVQKALIERAARLMLYIEMMDARALVEGTMTAHDSRMYLAWVNALRLCLREIGVEEAKPAKTAAGLDHYLAAAR